MFSQFHTNRFLAPDSPYLKSRNSAFVWSAHGFGERKYPLAWNIANTRWHGTKLHVCSTCSFANAFHWHQEQTVHLVSTRRNNHEAKQKQRLQQRRRRSRSLSSCCASTSSSLHNVLWPNLKLLYSLSASYP